MSQVLGNFIIGLLVVAILLSGLSLITIYELRGITVTGGATSGLGSANVTIGNSTDIVLLRSVANFGSGVSSGAALVISTQQDNSGGFDDGTEANSTNNFGTCANTEATCAYPFVVQNAGNINVSVNISAVSAASTWIGGTGATAAFKGKNNETGACGKDFTGLGGFGEGAWTTLDATWRTVCGNLSYSDTASDEMRIHFNVTIPTDVTYGAKGVVITVGALAS